MSYTKQNFTDGQVLTAAHLNHMEDGIAAGSAVSGLSETEKTNMLTLFATAKSASAEALAAYNALATAWGGTTEEPETGEKTILTTDQYYVWTLSTPLANGYNLPITPKVNMTLKGLRFKLQSNGAATLRVVITDTVESKDLAEVTTPITENITENGQEITVTFDGVSMVANRFYKIYIGTADGSKVLHYPSFEDSHVAENDYFSITRENDSDYHWSHPKIKYGGYVTLTV